MRVPKVLLLGMALAFFSASAWGDGATDPTIKMGAGGGSGATMDGATAADPIFVTDASGTSDWYLDNPTIAADGEVFVEVIPYEGESLATFLAETWTCEAEPPTTTSCGFLPGLQGLLSSADAQGFTYVAGCSSLSPTGAPVTVACPAVEVEFMGPFTVGEDVSIDVPEPRTILLLFFGLSVAFVLGFKKRQTLLA